jgi:hypothetical protein
MLSRYIQSEKSFYQEYFVKLRLTRINERKFDHVYFDLLWNSYELMRTIILERI